MSNDNFANATVLAGTTFVGNNTGYTTEVDEPNAEDTGGWATAWHIWITPDDFVGDAIIDTVGSSFDTYLWIYTGTAIDDLTEIDEDDDGAGINNDSKIIYNPVAGTVYYFRVGAYEEGEEGEYVLRYPYTTGSGAAPAPHTIDGTLFDSTYTQGQEGDVQVNVAVTSGTTFDSSVPPLFNTEDPGVDIDYRAPGSRAVNNENFEIFGVSAEGFTYIGSVPTSLGREPLTSDTAGAPGGTGEVLPTIDESGTKNTSEQNQALGVPSVNPDYRAPDRFGPGVELFDSTYTLGGFTTGVDLRKTVNSSVTADSYSIGATTLTNIQVPNPVGNLYLYGTSRGVVAYWYSSDEDISGAPTLDYEIYLSDGTTHRAGRYGAYDNHYLGTFIQCQSSLPVRARIVARNANGFSEPSEWSSATTPFNSDETGFGMQGIEYRDQIDGIWNADGTLKQYTGSPSVVKNIRGSRTDTDKYTLVWEAPDYAGDTPLNGYYIVVLENGATFAEGYYGSSTSHTFHGMTEGKEYTFFVWGDNNSNLWSPTPAPFIVTFDDATLGDVPDAPVLHMGGVGPISLDWTTPNDNGSNITDYSITPYLSSVAQTPILASAYGYRTVSGTNYVDSNLGLTNGSTYTFKIAAINSIGTGPQSNETSPGLIYVAPGAPTGVSGVAGDTEVVLSWTAPVSNGGRAITKYIVTPYIGATAQTPVDSVGTGTTKTITGLTNGTAYTFKVQANNTLYSAYSTASAPVTPHA